MAGKYCIALPLIQAVLRARALLKAQKPKVVVTFGGHITVPIALAAKTLGIPLIIHEQNKIPGLANRLLAPFANRILTGLPGPFARHKYAMYRQPIA